MCVGPTRCRLLTYLLTHLLTYSLTYLLTYLLTHSLTHSLTYVLTYLRRPYQVPPGTYRWCVLLRPLLSWPPPPPLPLPADLTSTLASTPPFVPLGRLRRRSLLVSSYGRAAAAWAAAWAGAWVAIWARLLAALLVLSLALVLGRLDLKHGLT